MPSGARSRPLAFPVYASEDGRDLTLSHETEVWGDVGRERRGG